MFDTFSSRVPSSRKRAETPTGWAIVVLAALLPFTVAYVVAGVVPELDGQFIAAIVGMAVLVAAVVVNAVSAIVNRLRHNESDDRVYW